MTFNLDEFIDILNGMSSMTKTPQDVLFELIDETRDYHQEIKLTGSTIGALSSNALYWAVKALLGVSFDSNFRVVFGNICHGFVQYLNERTIEGNPIDPKRALIYAIKKGRFSYYKQIPQSIRDKKDAKEYRSFKSLYDEAKPLCLTYLDTIHPRMKPIAAEIRLNYILADNDGNPLNITLSGQYDYIEEDCVTDLKTSKTDIKGEIVDDPVLEQSEKELRELQKKPTKDDFEKQLEQNVKDASKKPTKSELQEALETQIKSSNKILQAKRPSDEEKAEAQGIIDSCQKQLDEEIQRIETEHQIKMQSAQITLDNFVTSKETRRLEKIVELESFITPLREHIDRLQYHNDCLEAKKKHGKQLALYALLELLINGRKITKGRVVLMVRTKIPRVREFTFDIQDEVNKLIAEIDDIIGLVNVWRSGVSARYLFRPNRDSFIGSELFKIIDAINITEDIGDFEPLSVA